MISITIKRTITVVDPYHHREGDGQGKLLPLTTYQVILDESPGTQKGPWLLLCNGSGGRIPDGWGAPVETWSWGKRS